MTIVQNLPTDKERVSEDVREKVNPEVRPTDLPDLSDLSALSDQQLVDVYDNLKQLLLKGKLGEEEFDDLRIAVESEMQIRGIKPDVIENSEKLLKDSVERCYNIKDVVTYTIDPWGKITVDINTEKFSTDLALAMAENIENVTFTSDKSYKNTLFSECEVSSVKSSSIATPLEMHPFYSRLRDAKAQQLSSAKTTIKNKGMLKAGMFFMQPTHRVGDHPELPQTLESFAKEVVKESRIVALTKGLLVQIHKYEVRNKLTVRVWTSEGKDITKDVPQIVDPIMKNVPDSFIAVGVLHSTKLESKMSGEYLKDNIRNADLGIALQLYSVPVYADLSLLLDENEKAYELANMCQSNAISSALYHDVSTLRSAERVLRDELADEDVHCLLTGTIKEALTSYSNTLNTYVHTTKINAIVLEVTKGLNKNITVLKLGVEKDVAANSVVTFWDKDYIPIGNSLRTSVKAYLGDIVEVDTSCIRIVKVNGNVEVEALNLRVLNKISIGFPHKFSMLEKSDPRNLFRAVGFK